MPPEDVGGPHGYVEFRRVIADPDEPEYEHFRTWAEAERGFDPGRHRPARPPNRRCRCRRRFRLYSGWPPME